MILLFIMSAFSIIIIVVIFDYLHYQYNEINKLNNKELDITTLHDTYINLLSSNILAHFIIILYIYISFR
jgi:hypothetical protein